MKRCLFKWHITTHQKGSRNFERGSHKWYNQAIPNTQ